MRLIKGNVERIAETQAQAEKYISKGFKMLDVAKEAKKEEGKSLDKMNVTELKELAKQKGIEGYESLTKNELLAVLKDVEK